MDVIYFFCLLDLPGKTNITSLDPQGKRVYDYNKTCKMN